MGVNGYMHGGRHHFVMEETGLLLKKL